MKANGAYSETDKSNYRPHTLYGSRYRCTCGPYPIWVSGVAQLPTTCNSGKKIKAGKER